MQVYKKLFNCLNIIHLVFKIKKSGFEELDFVISSYIATDRIPKTVIFFDNINIIGYLEPYLQIWFF